MLNAGKVFGSFSVDDIPAAQAFYSSTLGVDAEEEKEMGMLRLRLAGEQEVMVYPKDDHTPATYTILNFVVDDIDKAVDELVDRGVTMARYDNFDQDEKGIVRDSTGSIAWFSDPAGNILSVVQM